MSSGEGGGGIQRSSPDRNPLRIFRHCRSHVIGQVHAVDLNASAVPVEGGPVRKIFDRPGMQNTDRFYGRHSETAGEQKGK